MAVGYISEIALRTKVKKSETGTILYIVKSNQKISGNFKWGMPRGA